MLKLDAEFHTAVAALTPGGTVHRPRTASAAADVSLHTGVAALIPGGTGPPDTATATTAADAIAVQRGNDEGGGLGIAGQPGHAVRDGVDDTGGLGVVDLHSSAVRGDDAGGLGVVNLHSHAVRQQFGSENVWMLNTGALEVSHKMRIDLHEVHWGGGWGGWGGKCES